MSYLEWRDYFFSEYRVESCRNDIVTEAVINENYIIKVENGENFSFRQNFAEDTLINSPIKKVEICIEDKVELESLAKSFLDLNGSEERENLLMNSFNNIKNSFEEGIVYKTKFQSNKEINRNLLEKMAESDNKWVYTDNGFKEEKPSENTYNLPLKNENKFEFKKKEMRIEIDKHYNFKSEINNLNEDEPSKKEENSENKQKKESDIFKEIKNAFNLRDEEPKENKNNNMQRESDIFKEMKNSFNLRDDDIDNYLKDARTVKLKRNKENDSKTKQNNEDEINDLDNVGNLDKEFFDKEKEIKVNNEALEKENKQIITPQLKVPDSFNTGYKVKDQISKVNITNQSKNNDRNEGQLEEKLNTEKSEEKVVIMKEKKSEVFTEFKPNNRTPKLIAQQEENSRLDSKSDRNEKKEEINIDNSNINNTVELKGELKSETISQREETLSSPSKNTLDNPFKNEQEYKIENYIDNKVLNNFLENQNRKKNKQEVLEKELTEKVNLLKQQNKVVSDENKKLLEILHLYKIIQNIENNESNQPIVPVEKTVNTLKTSKLHNRIKMHSEVENPVKEIEEIKQKNFNINPIVNDTIAKQSYNVVEVKDKRKEISLNTTTNLPKNIKNNKQIVVKNKFKQFIDLKLISPDSNSKSYKEIYKNQVRVKSPERETIYEESRKSNVISPSQIYGSKGKNFITLGKANKSSQNYCNPENNEILDNGNEYYNKYMNYENFPKQIENNIPSKSKEKNILVNSNSSGNLTKVIQKNKNQKFIGSSIKKKV